jgi:hypothetical protein
MAPVARDNAPSPPYTRYAWRLIERQIAPSLGKLAIGRLEVELDIDAGGQRDRAGGAPIPASRKDEMAGSRDAAPPPRDEPGIG